MKKTIPALILLAIVVTYLLQTNKSSNNNNSQIVDDSSLTEVKSVVVSSIEVDTVQKDSDTIIKHNLLIEDVQIDSIVFATQILPPIKKYHQKLFDEDYGKDTIEFRPGDIVEVYIDGNFISMKASPEYNNRIVAEYTDSTYTLDFNYLGDEEPEGFFYESRGHSVIIPIGSYKNTYNNTSLIEDDFDYDGNDDLLVTTYWYFGGASGSQTKFLFLKKGGKYELAYSDDMVYKSSYFLGDSTQDGYDYSKNGILFGSVSEYGEGSAGCCPSHFYDTETKFIDGKFKTIKKILTRHLVKSKDGRWDYVDVKTAN